MINQFFTFSSTIERLRQGPLSEYLDAYAASVAEQGYARHSIRRQIVAIADFSWWLRHKHIELCDLDSRIVDRFLRSRRRQQRLGRGDPKTLRRLLTLLCEKGAVKCQPAAPQTARSKIITEFQCYLSQDLGRSLSTLKNYVPFVDQFLLERFHNRAPNFTSLRAPDVTRFVMRHAHQLSPLRAGLMVTALRSFFRYLRHRGAIATDLAGCVPTVPIWSLSTLPRYLPTAAVERLLKRCDRKTAVGRRNHAILLLLARLGVRAGEVMGLSLDDIDWSTGLITIHGKGGKSAQLPLPPDARAALAAYLRRRGTIGPPLPSLQGRPIDVCSNALRRGARLLVDTHGRKHFVTAMVIPSIAMLPSLSAPIRVTADLCPQAVFRRRRNTGLPPSTTMEFHVSPLPRCPWLSSAGALQIQCSSLATVIIRETFVRAVSLRIPSTGRDSWTL